MAEIFPLSPNKNKREEKKQKGKEEFLDAMFRGLGSGLGSTESKAAEDSVSDERLKASELLHKTFWSYDELEGMYGGGPIPREVSEEHYSLKKKLLENHELGARQAASLELEAFMLKQWMATEDRRDKDHPMDYKIWSNRLIFFKKQNGDMFRKLEKLYPKDEIPGDVFEQYSEFGVEATKALNSGDEAKMAEILTAADAFIAEQNRRVSDSAESAKEINPEARKLETEEGVLKDEKTPGEWREELRGLIEGMKG